MHPFDMRVEFVSFSMCCHEFDMCLNACTLVVLGASECIYGEKFFGFF